MEKIISGAAEMTWDPDTRLVVLRFTSEANLTGRNAQELIAAISQWVGTEGKPFALLGDGGKLSGLDAEYRQNWTKFFSAHRKDAYIAFFNMNPFIRVAAEMFRLGSGIQLKAFADENEARAWLRDKGIAA